MLFGSGELTAQLWIVFTEMFCQSHWWLMINKYDIKRLMPSIYWTMLLIWFQFVASHPIIYILWSKFTLRTQKWSFPYSVIPFFCCCLFWMRIKSRITTAYILISTFQLLQITCDNFVFLFFHQFDLNKMECKLFFSVLSWLNLKSKKKKM